MQLSSKQLGTGLVIVGVVAGGYAFYDYLRSTGKLPGGNATAANVSVMLSPGSTVSAGSRVSAKVTFKNTGTTTQTFAVQGAMVRTGDNTVQGHWFTSYAADSEANTSNVQARVATVSVPAGGSASVDLYQMPTLPGTYSAIFWIAAPYTSGLIAQDTLYAPVSGVSMLQSATQATVSMVVN